MIIFISAISNVNTISIVIMGLSLFTNAYSFASNLNEKLKQSVSSYDKIGLLYKAPKEIKKLKKYNLYGMLFRNRLYCIALSILFGFVFLLSSTVPSSMEHYAIKFEFTNFPQIINVSDEGYDSELRQTCSRRTREIQADPTSRADNFFYVTYSIGSFEGLVWARLILSLFMLLFCGLLIVNIFKIQHLQLLVFKANR